MRLRWRRPRFSAFTVSEMSFTRRTCEKPLATTHARMKKAATRNGQAGPRLTRLAQRTTTTRMPAAQATKRRAMKRKETMRRRISRAWGRFPGVATNEGWRAAKWGMRSTFEGRGALKPAMRAPLIVAFLLCAAAAHAADIPAVERAVIEGTNRFRQEEGLASVRPDSTLDRTAREFADYLA